MGMLSRHLLFEYFAVKRFWGAACLTLDQCGPNVFHISVAGLIAAYQIANIFTVIGEMTG